MFEEFNGESFFKHLSKKSSQEQYRTFYSYLTDVGKELGEDQPFYAIDFADVLWKAQLWNEKFPKVAPYYAVKANSDPKLLRLFVLLGYGFDCSTEGEIREVVKCGGSPKNIIFAHTVKTRRALQYARSIGCDLLTFDSQEELQKIKEHFPEARLILRLKSASTQSVYNLSSKFGRDISETKDLLQIAKKLELDVVGVSFHVGSLCDDPKVFTSSIEDSRAVFNIAKQLGYDLTIVDIGAGFYGSIEKEEYFGKLSAIINDFLKENFPDSTTEFIAEPGCYYVCSAATLLTTIIGKRVLSKNETEKYNVKRDYYINDGFYGSFFEHKELYGVRPIPVLSPAESRSRPLFPSRVWGQTCCSEDMVCPHCALPDMQAGEMIAWENTGAYNRGVCSTFTQVPLPETRHVFIRNKKLNLSWVPNIQDISDFFASGDLREGKVDLIHCGCITTEISEHKRDCSLSPV